MPATAPRPILDLSYLSAGMVGLTPATGTVMAECAAVCLHGVGHKSQTELKVSGAFDRARAIAWEVPSPQTRRSHHDEIRATEDGAYGVAILLVLDETSFEVLEKSCRGTGFDYWVGHHDSSLFQNKARLEVSGILHGTEADIANRARAKVRQTMQSDKAISVPAYIVIVEFGRPQAHVVTR